MSAPNNGLRATLSPTAIAEGAAVRSVEWQDAAALANYVRSMGSVLVPAFGPLRTIAAGVKETFRFRTCTSGTTKQRVLLISLRSASTTVNTTGEVLVPSGGTSTIVSAPASFSDVTATAIYFSTAITAPTEVDIDFDVQAGTTGVIVTSVAILEVPRFALDCNSTELGIDLNTVRAGDPVFDVDDGSYAALGRAVLDARTNNGRRNGIWHYFNPGGYTTTSAAYVDVFALYAPVLTRLLFTGVTARNVAIRVYASIPAGDGTVRFTDASSGATVGITVNGGDDWYPTTAGSPAGINVDCEDLTTADGLRAAAWDTLRCQVRSNTGDAITLYGFSIWEDSLDS
jgi:hypothetical protein